MYLLSEFFLHKEPGKANCKVWTIILFFACLIAFCFIAIEIVINKNDWFDAAIFNIISPYANPAAVRFFEVITFFGSSYFFFPSFIVLATILLIKKCKRDALFVIIAGITSTALLNGLKMLFERPRPELPLLKPLTNYSFPSGHAFGSLVVFCLVIWQIHKTGINYKWKIFLNIFFLLFVLLISVSRIVLRYHYASDVVAGLLLGNMYIIVFLWFYKKKDTPGIVGK